MWGILKTIIKFMILGAMIAMMLFIAYLGVLNAWTWGY